MPAPTLRQLKTDVVRGRIDGLLSIVVRSGLRVTVGHHHSVGIALGGSSMRRVLGDVGRFGLDVGGLEP